MDYLMRHTFTIKVPQEIDSRGDAQWFFYKTLRSIIENPECDVLDDFDRLLEQSGINWSDEVG